MEEFELEKFPTSESAKRQLGYVSEDFYAKSYVGKWLFQVMGLEYDDAREIMENLPEQFFPETATWGLMYHEIKWQLPVRESLSYEERRKLIYEKRDYRAPMTPYRMETYLANTTGFEVHIADKHDPGEYGYVFRHPNTFRVTFIGEGTLDTQKARELLDRLKQSHTTYTMNDRVITVLDNRELEKFFLRNIRLNARMPFWDCPIFDGSWKFDGSLLFNARRRYNMILGLKYAEGEAIIVESVFVRKAKLQLRVQTEECFVSAGAAKMQFGIDFWKALYFDGSRKFDGKTLLDSVRQNIQAGIKMRTSVETKKETIGSANVTVRRNLAFFDGALRMDGSRIMNSLNRKEAL